MIRESGVSSTQPLSTNNSEDEEHLDDAASRAISEQGLIRIQGPEQENKCPSGSSKKCRVF